MVFGINFKKIKSKIYKPYVHAEQYANIQDVFKGKKVQVKKKFPKELGIEHPFDFGMTEDLIKRVPIVNGAINKYLDFIVAPGFYVESKNTKAKELIQEFIVESNFEIFLRDWIKQALNGNGYAEIDIEEGSNDVKLQVLDNKYMYIDRDDNGNIKGYKQYIGMFNNKINFASDVTSFEPNEVAHIAFNKIGDCPYGYGLVYPALSAIDGIIGSEKDLHTLMRRKANSPYHIKVGDNDENIPSSSDLDNISKKFEWLDVKHEWVTDALMDIKPINFGDVGGKFDFVLQHDIEMFSFGTQIPAVIMGIANVPEGLANIQLEAFDRNIKSLQNETEKEVETKIFRVILQNAGIDAHVEMVWGQPSKQERDNEIKNITELLKNPMLNTELVYQLELKLATLMGIDPDELEEAEVEREKEAEEPTPPLKQPSESLREKETMDKFYGSDLTIREWINVNIEEYTQKIIDHIKINKFSDLAAKNYIEAKAGLLAPFQIDKLKTTLIEGFQNNHNMRVISKNILKEVNPPTRYKIKNGEIARNKAGKKIIVSTPERRSMNIARTEVIRNANDGRTAYYKEKGVEKVRWVCAYGPRTCDICANMDGTIFNIGDAPNSLHSLCRCTTVPVVDLK